MGREDLLFCHGDLGDVLRQHIQKTVRSVDTIPESRFRTLSDAELVVQTAEAFAVTPIALLEGDRTVTREETKIDVSAWPGRNMFGDRGPIFVPGIRVMFAIPFHGDADLWKLRPSTFTSVYPRGHVRANPDRVGGMLEIVIEQPADEPLEIIKRRYEDNLKDIQFYLGHQRTQVVAELAGLAGQIAAAVTRRRQLLSKHDNLESVLGVPVRPSIGKEPPAPERPRTVPRRANPKAPLTRRSVEWDVFVCHASEDKEAFARPLAQALQRHGLKVWFDEMTLRVGDSLRRSIDLGLAKSRFGIVIISPAFLNKEWPQKELDGLAAREIDGQKVILPVWHNVDSKLLLRYSPTLADRFATSSAKGLDKVVEDLTAAIKGR